MVTLFSIKNPHKDDEGALRPAFAPFEVSRRLAQRIRDRDRRVFTLEEFADYVAVGKGCRRTALNAGAPDYVADEPEACAEWLLGKAGLLEDPAPAADDEGAVDLYSLTNAELRDRLSAEGLPVYGTKDELVARLSGEEE